MHHAPLGHSVASRRKCQESASAGAGDKLAARHAQQQALAVTKNQQNGDTTHASA